MQKHTQVGVFIALCKNAFGQLWGTDDKQWWDRAGRLDSTEHRTYLLTDRGG